MDYAYFGPSVGWPVASAVASIAGILLMLARRLGQGASPIHGVTLDDLRRFPARLARPWLAAVGLLAVPAAFPGSAWVGTLRGDARIESEMELARTEGYYEDLTRSTPDRKRTSLADRPPCRKSFTESGLMDEVADFRWRVLRPNLDTEWNGTTFRTNSLGFRGPEISLRKPPGTFRVVVLGSSNTMGHGINDEGTYARRLERWLAERAGTSRRVEVVNMAVSGDSPTQQLLRLRDEVPNLDPDWILSDITALDLSLEEQHLRWVLDTKVEVPFDFVREALAGSKVNADDSPDVFHKKFSPYLKPLLDRTVEKWAVEARRIGIPLTVVILPRADSKIASPHLFQLFRDLSDRHGLRYVDLSGTFDRLELDDFRIAPWDHHPNALGHRLIFAGLRDAARRRGIRGSA